MTARKCAVIGAGPLGLMTLKNLIEEGFDVTCFEGRPYVGGLWKYSQDGNLSVAEGTVFNSSRYRVAISDFPFTKDVDDFPTWQQMYKYFNDYADHFNLRPHIQLNTKVTHISRKGDQWEVETESSEDGQNVKPQPQRFDKVAIAIGTFYKPKKPDFDGIDKFTGMQSHAMHFHGSPEIKGKNVLMIGLHATAVDVAQTLKKYGAAKVYAAHKNGLVMLSRYAPNGATFDQAMTVNFTKFQILMTKLAPNLFTWLLDTMVRKMSRATFPEVEEKWKFSPAPSFAATAPVVGDEIYPMMRQGFLEPVDGVRRITGPKTIELTDGRVLDDIDAIVYCTGYDTSGSIIEREYDPYSSLGAVADLYRGVFPLHPDPAVRNSLAWIGHGGVPFPGFVAFEMVGLGVIQVWKGTTSLPPLKEMRAWHDWLLSWREDIKRRYKVKSTFYVFLLPIADHLLWFDKAAGTNVLEHFGWSWKAWRFWWQDRDLYRRCASGVWSPSLFRLFESGKRKVWPHAREQILEDQRIAAEQVKRKKAEMDMEKAKAKVQ